MSVEGNKSAVRRYVEDVIALEDAEIVEGMRFLLERCKLVAEPAGAAATAAVLLGKVPVRSGEREMLRRPARASCRRAAFLHRIQKSMRNGRIDIARARIPYRGRYLGNCRMDPDRNGFAGVVHRLLAARFPTPYCPILFSIPGVPPRRKDPRCSRGENR